MIYSEQFPICIVFSRAPIKELKDTRCMPGELACIEINGPDCMFLTVHVWLLLRSAAAAAITISECADL